MEQMTVRVATSGEVVGIGKLRRKEGRLTKKERYGWRDMVGQWRACGQKAATLWRRHPRVFDYVKDPALGPCAVFRNTAIQTRRNRHFDALHPYVKNAAYTLRQRAQQAGIKLRILSGYRPHRHKKSWRTRRYKSYSHWHAWGMAFDVNLAKYKRMSTAKKNYKKDEAQWLTLARIALELGLTWSGEHRSKDIFHFEWHPGHGGYIRREELRPFLELAGPNGQNYKAMWRLFPHPSLSR